MSVLLKKARARNSEDKEQRRIVLRDAALSLFAEVPFHAVRMADVAERAKLAKGTVFLYYPTKEALFLDLLETRLFGWLDRLEGELEAGRGPYSVARFARVVRQLVESDAMLVRLLVLLSGVIEQNVEVDAVVAFKQRLAVRLGAIGSLLERRLAFLAPGDGARILLRVNALVVGLHPMSASNRFAFVEDASGERDASAVPPALASRASGAAQPVLRPELGILVVPFEDELETCLLAILRGMAANEP